MKNFKLYKNYSFKSCLYNHFKRPSINLMFKKADTVMDLYINKVKIWTVFFCLLPLYFLSTNIVQGLIMPQGICKNSGVTPSAKNHQKGYEHLGKIVFPDLPFNSRYLSKYPNLYWSIVLSPVALQVSAASSILTLKVSLGMNSYVLNFPIFHNDEHSLELYKDHIQKMSIAFPSNAESSFKTYINNSVSLKQVRNREILDHFQIIVPKHYSLHICLTALQAASNINSYNATFKQDKELIIKENLQRNNVIPSVNENKIENLNNCLVIEKLDKTQHPVSKVDVHSTDTNSLCLTNIGYLIVVFYLLALWTFSTKLTLHTNIRFISAPFRGLPLFSFSIRRCTFFRELEPLRDATSLVRNFQLLWLHVCTQVLRLVCSFWWVFVFVNCAFQCFSLSFEVLGFVVRNAFYSQNSFQMSSLSSTQLVIHILFKFCFIISFTFNISYSFVALNILTIARKKCCDTMCFTTSSQHTMAGSHWDGTSSFTSSLQHTCVSGRTLGAYKCILSPRMVILKQQPSVSLTIQGLMSLSCKAIIIFFSDLKCSTKECHIISKLLHIFLWGAALQLSLKVFTISTLYLWCSYKLLYTMLYISLMNFWNFIKSFFRFYSHKYQLYLYAKFNLCIRSLC